MISERSQNESVEVYDPSEKTCNAGPDMIIDGRGASACVLDDKIYVVGGRNGTRMERSAEV